MNATSRRTVAVAYATRFSPTTAKALVFLRPYLPATLVPQTGARLLVTLQGTQVMSVLLTRPCSQPTRVGGLVQQRRQTAIRSGRAPPRRLSHVRGPLRPRRWCRARIKVQAFGLARHTASLHMCVQGPRGCQGVPWSSAAARARTGIPQGSRIVLHAHRGPLGPILRVLATMGLLIRPLAQRVHLGKK